MNPLHLYEAYSAVYDEELRDELLDSMNEEIDVISELQDEELEEIVEETILDLLDEGYVIEEIEEIFNDIISEAKVTIGRGGEAGEGTVTTGSGSRRAAAARLADTKKRKREKTIQKVKSAVKTKVAKVKAAPGQAAAAAQKTSKDIKQRSHVGLAKYASSRNLMPGAGLKTQSSTGRSQLRSAVLGDIASRAKAKLKRAGEKAREGVAKAQVAAYNKGREVSQSASDTTDRLTQSVKNKAAVTKRGLKGLIRKGAEKVARGAERVASRMAEEVDLYDVVLEYLLDEGYAETPEAAEVIMVNMSEDWRDSIIEDYKEFPTHKVMTKAGKLMGDSAGKTDPKSKKKEQRGIKMMDVMMQHTPDR